jgi:hypothetical protein
VTDRPGATASPASRIRAAPAARIARAAAVILLAGLVAACTLPDGALDAPFPVVLRISTTPTEVVVDAPNWLADRSAVFLCPSEPPPLPEPGPERDGWLPGPPCHDYGRFDTPDGLATTLPLDGLSGAERTAFAAAPDWYVYLVDLDGEHASSATKTRFSPPGGFEAG